MHDASELFNQPKYSDVTIKLGDGTLVYAHKVIICERNEYFDKLCGAESPFAESKQAVVELKEDDPVALRALLHRIYQGSDGSIRDYEGVVDHWQYWLNLRNVADKYLEPYLREGAHRIVCGTVRGIQNVDEIFDIIDTFERDMSLHGEFDRLAEELKEKHHVQLLQNKRFRAKIAEDGVEAVWSQVDKLLSVLSQRDENHLLCNGHREEVFGDDGEMVSAGKKARKGKAFYGF